MAVPRITSFLITTTQQPHKITKTSKTSITTCSSSTNTQLQMSGPGNIQRPQNEFSRTFRTDIVLGARRKEYSTSIAANNEELIQLAKRFSLSNISKLEATLEMKRDYSGRTPMQGGTNDIIIKGHVNASVTQTCCRTNEDFEVDLEFDIFTSVRATGSNTRISNKLDTIGGMSVADIQNSFDNGGGKNSYKQKGNNNTNRRRNNKSVSMQKLEELKMRQIEEMLQCVDSDDDVFEDEAVFTSDGVLDAGELVAQLFRVKLDPYPKKPGSEPVQYSITG
jgi:hypothetical protein